MRPFRHPRPGPRPHAVAEARRLRRWRVRAEDAESDPATPVPALRFRRWRRPAATTTYPVRSRLAIYRDARRHRFSTADGRFAYAGMLPILTVLDPADPDRAVAGP